MRIVYRILAVLVILVAAIAAISEAYLAAVLGAVYGILVFVFAGKRGEKVPAECAVTQTVGIVIGAVSVLIGAAAEQTGFMIFFFVLASVFFFLGRKPMKELLRPWEEKQAKEKEARRQQRAVVKERQAQGVACCPRCGCTSLSSNKRGYRVGRGVLWGVLLAAVGFWLFTFIGAGVGLALGLSIGCIGSSQVWCTCLSCGYRFRAGMQPPGRGS